MLSFNGEHKQINYNVLLKKLKWEGCPSKFIYANETSLKSFSHIQLGLDIQKKKKKEKHCWSIVFYQVDNYIFFC